MRLVEHGGKAKATVETIHPAEITILMLKTTEKRPKGELNPFGLCDDDQSDLQRGLIIYLKCLGWSLPKEAGRAGSCVVSGLW